MKAFAIVAVWLTATVILSAIGDSCAQNLQLSYTNADIAEKLVRQATTTPAPASTTKKSTFFGGIRNLFKSGSKDSTTVDPASVVAPTTPAPKTAAVGPVAGAGGSKSTIAALIVPPPTVKPVEVSTSTSTSTTTTSTSTTTTTPRPPAPPTTTAGPTTTSTTTSRTPTFGPRPRDPLHDFESYAGLTLSTKKPKTKEDFPALPAPRTPRPSPSAAVGGVGTAQSPTPSPVAVPNAWGNGVSFVTTARPKSSAGGVGTTTPASATTTTTTAAANANGAEQVSDAELEALTEVLYGKETSLLPLVTLNYQSKTQSSGTADEAPLPLITVNEAALNALPTVAKMKLLYNNYEQDTTVNEHVTAMERAEENDFVDALLAHPLMRHTMQYLQQRGRVTLDPRTHRELLKTIWFSLYSRGKGKIGSSAFEHVFLTELRNGTVSGFHNWIYYYFEEQAGRANYQGWLKRTELGAKAAIVKYRFAYNGVMKPVNAMFVGTSPELEVALYTLCFAMRADRECAVSLGGQRLKIRTHTFRYRGKNLIGSAFPEI